MLRDSLRILRLRITLPLLLRDRSLPELMRLLDEGAAPSTVGHSTPGDVTDRDARPPAGGPGAAVPRGDRVVPLVVKLTRPVRLWQTTCLWRALAGYAALRAHGDPVRFLIGVKLDAAGELAAHAWLTRAGQPSLLAPRDDEGYRVAFAWPPDPAILPRHTERTMDGFQASDEAVLTELKDGTGVLLHLGTKQYYTLNPTGVLLWKLLSEQGASTSGAVAAGIAARFPQADAAAVRADVDALLSELSAEGLVSAPR